MDQTEVVENGRQPLQRVHGHEVLTEAGVGLEGATDHALLSVEPAQHGSMMPPVNWTGAPGPLLLGARPHGRLPRRDRRLGSLRALDLHAERRPEDGPPLQASPQPAAQLLELPGHGLAAGVVSVAQPETLVPRPDSTGRHLAGADLLDLGAILDQPIAAWSRLSAWRITSP